MQWLVRVITVLKTRPFLPPMIKYLRSFSGSFCVLYFTSSSFHRVPVVETDYPSFLPHLHSTVTAAPDHLIRPCVCFVPDLRGWITVCLFVCCFIFSIHLSCPFIRLYDDSQVFFRPQCSILIFLC